MIKTYTIKDKIYCINFENDCNTVDNAVYELEAEDGCCVIGNCGQEGVDSRIQKRFSEKASVDFMKHVSKTGRFTVRVLFQCQDKEKRYIIENYAILKNAMTCLKKDLVKK